MWELDLDDSPNRVAWHTLSVDRVFELLDSSADGLSSEMASTRLDEIGPNTLPTEEAVRPWELLLDQVRSPLIYMLVAAAVAALLLGKTLDAGVIAVVILLNTVVGFIQEYQAARSLLALAEIISPRARVIRDGQEREVAASTIVVGDVITLESGRRVPADARLFRHYELTVDESTLSGESLPVPKVAEPQADPEANLADQRNMLFLGTVITRGRGAAVVTATGPRTVLGRVSEVARTVGRIDTPLQVNLARFAQFLVVAVLALAALVVILGLLRGEALADIVLTAISTAVATIPEGLPVTVTVALAVGVSRMAQRHAIIRKLPAVETLGSTTVIGSDKTGTLTKNEMTVSLVWAGGNVYDVSGAGYEPVGEFRLNGEPIAIDDHPPLAMALRAGLLANESRLYRENGRYRPDGDPTEVALIVAAEKAGLCQEHQSSLYPLIDVLPFESDRQYMATLHTFNGQRILFAKGSPERISESSESGFDGRPVNREEIKQLGSQLASEGLRVLATAYREVDATTNEIDPQMVERGLIFLGLEGLQDPPRPEAIEAIARAKEAGIRVLMITGDQKVTAQAIAETMKIGTKVGADGQIPVLEGRQLADMSDDELYAAVTETSVYARAAPLDKLRVVRQLRRHGEVVAVTGDGVNDAAALKAADIGVAMGRPRTDAAKEASEMVLTDDNFATIFAAVEEGRVVFDNIRKVVLFLIPTGFSVVMVVLASIVIGLPLPFLPAQVIWINLVTNGLQDVAMAFEPPDGDVTKRPPRPRREGIFTTLMLQRTALVAIVLAIGTLGLFALELGAGMTVEGARTVALTVMVLFQNFHIFNTRSFTRSLFVVDPLSNRFLFFSIVAALGMQIIALYWPPLQVVLGTRPLTLNSWLVVIAVASSVLWAVEIDKAIRRWIGRN